MDLSMLCSFCMIYIIVKKYLKCIIRINLKAIKSLKKRWTNVRTQNISNYYNKYNIMQSERVIKYVRNYYAGKTIHENRYWITYVHNIMPKFV